MPKARARIPVYVEGPDGRPLAGASVYVRTDPGGADAVIYSARTGGTTLPNPATSGADGRIAGYVERGDYAATVTASGMSPDVQTFEAAPGAADGIDADWLDDDASAAGLVAVRQADGSISWAKVTSSGIDDGAVGSEQIADASILLADLATGATGARNAFLKLATIADRKVAFGGWAYDGNGTNTRQFNVTHALGVQPTFIGLTSTRIMGAGFARTVEANVESGTVTNTIFNAVCQTSDGQPMDAAAAALLYWVAIG